MESVPFAKDIAPCLEKLKGASSLKPIFLNIYREKFLLVYEKLWLKALEFCMLFILFCIPPLKIVWQCWEETRGSNFQTVWGSWEETREGPIFKTIGSNFSKLAGLVLKP